MKKISRKLILTYVCIALTVILQVVASITHTDSTTAMVIIAVACGVYNVSNVAQKIGGKEWYQL